MAKKQVKNKEDDGNTENVAVKFANVIPGKDKIQKQYLEEKVSAIKVRQTKINNWVQNEALYNGVVQKTLMTRSNLHVPKLFEGVHTLSSKLGEAPTVEYTTKPEGDENAADMMKHVVLEDLTDSSWELIYENSKIECGLYGRAIYEVIPGNDKQCVELVDTMAFLISPIAKNTKDALYQGRQFIYKTMAQIEDEAEKMGYDMEEVDKLKTLKVPNDSQQDTSAEASAKNLRLANLGLSNVNQYGSKVAELTSWWTYLVKKGKPVLYNLIVANDLYLLRAKPAEELGLKRPPFISWATYTRGITFWCPSVADLYRDPNLAIDVCINQQVDNNTYRNFGMMFVASDSGLKQASIVPRPLGVTPVTVQPGQNVKDKVWQFTPPEITSSIHTMQTINTFADNASGLTAAPVSTKGGKMGVSQQAAANAAVEMKTSIMKKQSTIACQELYQLMADLTADRMTKPRDVKIFGYKDITITKVTYKNFEDVELVAKATPAENSQENKQSKQKAKKDLYELFKDDPKVPGQVALRRSVTKSYDIPPSEAETWFSKEEQPAPPQGQPQAPGAPQPDQGMVTPESAILSQTQTAAKADAVKP